MANDLSIPHHHINQQASGIGSFHEALLAFHFLLHSRRSKTSTVERKTHVACNLFMRRWGTTCERMLFAGAKAWMDERIICYPEKQGDWCVHASDIITRKCTGCQL
jgi:hypothetical protein